MRAHLLVLALLVSAPACDDTNERRAAAIQATRGADDTLAERGAAELERILEKAPRDRLALDGLARHYQRRGRNDDARYLYERLAVAGYGFEEGEHAKLELQKLALPAPSSSESPASASASAPPSGPAPTAIVLGKGLANVALGMPREAAEKVVGPCEREQREGGALICTFVARGMELVYKEGKVARVGLYGSGRELVAGRARTAFVGFAGASTEGVTLGMASALAESLLGHPAHRRAPLAAVITREGSITMQLWDYPEKGVTLEIDTTRGGALVSGIQIPTIEGRPLPAPGKP